MHGEHWISSSEQHHAATKKVDIAGATHFSIAAERGADLLDHVGGQAGFVSIDFGD
jgi:hypothetical protein